MITIDPTTAPDAVKSWLELVKPEIEAEIAHRLSADDAAAAASAGLAFPANGPGDVSAGELVNDPGRLREAMRYAALTPGKRLRPALAMAACAACGSDRSAALPAAAAIEMLHAYTLVHDDLPAMDNDLMRRGKPTVHVAFGEAIAVLAGDALLTAAFGALADLGTRAGAAVGVLARRAGALELLAGQARDITGKDRMADLSFEEMELLHAHKTGALFAAATELGGIAGGGSADECHALGRYGLAIGIAFQHADDRDDGEFGMHAERATQRMKELTQEAAELARGFGEHGRTLLAIATWMGTRA